MLAEQNSILHFSNLQSLDFITSTKPSSNFVNLPAIAEAIASAGGVGASKSLISFFLVIHPLLPGEQSHTPYHNHPKKKQIPPEHTYYLISSQKIFVSGPYIALPNIAQYQ